MSSDERLHRRKQRVRDDLSKQRRDSIANLLDDLGSVADESKSVGEALQSSAFARRQRTILIRVNALVRRGMHEVHG